MKKAMILSGVLAAMLLGSCGDTSAIDDLVQERGITTTTAAPAADEASVSETETGDDYLSYFLDSSEAEEPETRKNTDGALEDPESYEVPGFDDEFDVDLSTMSSTIVYATVADMMEKPESYLGKTVKMKGPFAYYQDEETGNEYFAVIITDATACCSTGIEFLLEGDYTYPEDYPALDTEVYVVGIFDYYTEGYMMYIRLDNARLEISGAEE